jgi:hypothetical protein
VQENGEQRRERERQERLISRSIAKGTPNYYLNNPHMLQKDNSTRNVILIVAAFLLVSTCVGS